jgi:hypothetical protein
MKILLTFSIFITLLFSLNSCASGYRPIYPKIISYASKTINNNNEILLEYKYDLLYKKYKRKESRYGLRVVAVKITNLNDQDLVLGKDLNFTFENGASIPLLSSKEIYMEIKQHTGVYLLYLLLTPLQFRTSTTNSTGGQNTNSLPIGYIIGPGLAAGNMIRASSSNRQFNNDLKTYNLKDHVIKKGETTYGLVGIRSSNYDVLKLKRE